MIHGDDMDGILLINKEAGMTSHDVVAQLRKILHIKKIGHSGTLDPNATGVLLVLVGRACKVLPFLADTDKEYIASMELGKKTISDDIWEEVLDEKPVIPIKDLQKELDKFRGVIEQEMCIRDRSCVVTLKSRTHYMKLYFIRIVVYMQIDAILFFMQYFPLL